MKESSLKKFQVFPHHSSPVFGDSKKTPRVPQNLRHSSAFPRGSLGVFHIHEPPLSFALQILETFFFPGKRNIAFAASTNEKWGVDQ